MTLAMAPPIDDKDPHPAIPPVDKAKASGLALAYPILSGKTPRWRRTLAELKGARRSEFEASQLRVGIVRDLFWIQSTPQADLGVRYVEAAEPMVALQGLQRSNHPFDAWLRDETLGCAAFDPYALAGNGRQIVDVNTGGGGPTHPIAFTVPIIPGMEGANLIWAKEFRLDSQPFAEMLRRATVVRQCVWQYETPAGALSVVFVEARQPAKAFETWAMGQGSFERLLRTKILEIHGVDLSQRAPPPELAFEWDAAASTRGN